MSYNHLNKDIFIYNEYSVVAFRQEDLYLIKTWRNEQIDVLRQKRYLTDEDQLKYYQTYILPSFSKENTSIMLFSFLQKNECIGYGGLTNIHWEDKRVELSFLVETERTKNNAQYALDFSAFITLMKEVTFKHLGFNRIFTETYDIRPLHIKTLETNGFVQEGRMRQHVNINGKFVDSLIHGYIKEQYELEE